MNENFVYTPNKKSNEELDESAVTQERDIALLQKDCWDTMRDALVANGVPEETIGENAAVRPNTLLYLLYWYARQKNEPLDRQKIIDHLHGYLTDNVSNVTDVIDALASNTSLVEVSQEYVEKLMIPVPTVDLVITKGGIDPEKSVLTIKRNVYPYGDALPGTIIRDNDEDNPLEASAPIFAALRAAAENVLGVTHENARYTIETDTKGRPCYAVRGQNKTPVVRVYAIDEGAFRYNENVNTLLQPTDPRHLVATTGFRCEFEGELPATVQWAKRSDIMNPKSDTGGFAFGHHREIYAHISAKTPEELENSINEHEFVRSLINEPLEAYTNLKQRFAEAGNSPEASFPELMPVVNKLLDTLENRPDVIEMCEKYPPLMGFRREAFTSLRHVALGNRVTCPYSHTMQAIVEAMTFFDVLARQKRGYYDDMDKRSIEEPDPRRKELAEYHAYRYKYRFNELLGAIPHQIVIPTFEATSATDLMRVRCTPIRFVGLSLDPVYVDEFLQTPREFLYHDGNHSWRMWKEDQEAETKYERTSEDMLTESYAFSKEYLDSIKIRNEDTEEERELKKLKKIILFEIVHEDARPFLKDVICKFIQVKEGNRVPFEGPGIDPKTRKQYVVETLDQGIATLSYVRSKLQHGFYDHIDSQMPQIVDPKYRTSTWIARAAYEMLVELEAKPEEHAEVDEFGHVSQGWLLKRVLTAGPDNIHDAAIDDPDAEAVRDKRLNEKRYQLGAQS